MSLKHSTDPETFFRRFRRVLERVPDIAGMEAVNHFKANFEKQGFDDKGVEKWEERQNQRSGKGRGILIKSSRLMNSIRIVRITRNSVVVGTDVPYGKIHNEGGEINQTVTVPSHTRRTRSGRSTRVRSHQKHLDITIPQRKYIGRSESLNYKISREIIRQLKRI